MEIPYKIKPLKKTGTRKYWKGKNSTSYTTSLPKEWVEKYAKNDNEDILLSQIEETLLITPNKNQEEKPKTLELKINSKNANEIYYSVISAYLQDYSSVCLKQEENNPTLKEKLNAIDEKLPGAEFGKDGDDYRVTFERKIENIPKKVDEIYNHYVELYSQNKKMFSGTIKESDIKTEYGIVTKKESLVDNKVYALKRLFTHVFETFLHNPAILIDTGLLRDEEGIDYTAAYKIAGYRSVANTLERITDIQKDIFELLMKLSDAKITLPESGKYGFPQYYDHAHDMIKDAYTSKKVAEYPSGSKEGFEYLLKVLAAEDNEKNEIRYREGYMSFEEREKILNLVKGRKSPDIGALEGLIWGSTGLATNIAETWINMSNLAEINKIKKDSMSTTKSKSGSHLPIKF